MVILYNRDLLIYDFAYRICDIVSDYQKNGRVEISTNLEGICLNSAGVYAVLDYACECFDIDKSKVYIHTSNVEETHPDYNIVIKEDRWIDTANPVVRSTPVVHKNADLYHVAMFVGRPNWHRAVLAAWLYRHYQTQTLQTFHFDPIDEILCKDLNLSEVLINSPSQLPNVVSFLESCPLTGVEGFINPTIGPDKHYTIISEYKKFFLELVDETYVTGSTFFITEKTLRPIICSTPFVAMGPAGFLGNLQRVGFKTFNHWWDESYDNYSGNDRVEKIQEVLRLIFSWDQDRIQTALSEMAPILFHNRELLKTLNGNSLKLK